MIEAQQSDLSDIDNKAMRTVRITIILGGVIISAGQFAGVKFAPLIAAIGLALLMLSVTVGVLTYSESDLILGPNREYINSQINGSYKKESWDDDLLAEMGTWIEKNAALVRLNGWLFAGQIFLLTVGIFVIAASIVTSSLGIGQNAFLYALAGLLLGFITSLGIILLYRRVFTE